MSSTVDVAECVRRLHVLCQERYPEASALRHIDAFAALAAVVDLTVDLRPGHTKSGCPVDGRFSQSGSEYSIEIRLSGSDARDRFTAMHEFGHLLITQDEVWQYGPRIALGDQARNVEESVVNAFASESLIPDSEVNRHVGQVVTAEQVRSLYEATQASASACLVRTLGSPGNRCVMLTDVNGTTYFSDSTGEPYAPGRGVPQPAVARAIEQALKNGGLATLAGGEGLAYRSGKTNPHVRLDVAVADSGRMVFVIATPSRFDSRVAAGGDMLLLTCGVCGEEFAPNLSPGLCAKCREHACPRCRSCGCSTEPAPCELCFTTLAIADVQAGRQCHEECPW